MGRNLSPTLRRELENLDKDADSRKSAMKALKAYVKDLDSKAIPLFLAQVFESKGPGSTSGEYTISLYEVLARVHGCKIVPQIDNIMSTIVKTLTSSAGSFALHQACSKVVPTIAKYGIDPSMSDIKKAQIIRSLCNPLCNVLMGPSENVASGAALCLRALVESDGWRFASDDIVNDICLLAAGALEEHLTQTNAHMGLAMALAKHNSFVLEAYARSLVRSGLQILTAGTANSQKRLSAIQMVNFLMKCVDSRCILSELAKVIDVMEKCDADQMPFVRGAAFEALQTARTVAAEKGSRSNKDRSPMTGSNFSKKDNGRRSSCSNQDDTKSNRSRSPRSLSPESWTINSFNEYDSSPESPLSNEQASCNFKYGRHTNRRLWNNENGGVDVSLKDGLYSEVSSCRNCSRLYLDHLGDGGFGDTKRDCSEAFTGFIPASPTKMVTKSATPIPQGPQLPHTFDDIKIFRTPTKVIKSLQDVDNFDLEFSKNQNQKMRNMTSEVGMSATGKLNGDGLSQDFNYKGEGNSLVKKKEANLQNNNVDDDQGPDGFESVSSTGYALENANGKVSYEVTRKEKNAIESGSHRNRRLKKATLSLVCGLSLIFPAIILSSLWVDNQEEYFSLVPT